MSIYKKHKVFSEKLTSVEDPIAVVQRGSISFAPSKGTAFMIPTFIENVVGLTLIPRTAVTAAALAASNAAGKTTISWWSDLKKYYATNAASSGFGSLASLVAASEIGGRIRMVDSKLYIPTEATSAHMASNTGITDTASSAWRQLEEFGSNSQSYLVVNIGGGAGPLFAVKTQHLNFEVTGYEY